MGKVYFDENDLRRIGEEMKQAADYFGMVADNVQWKVDLKPYETIMISDVKNDFMLKEFNGNADELKRVSTLSLGYSDLAYYYQHKAERDRIYNSIGLIVESKYDCNLTLEEAVPKYLGCSLEEAVSAYNIMNEVSKKYDYYEASIRNNYKGSLGEIVGKSDEEYKKAYPEEKTTFSEEAAADFKNALSKYKPSEEAMSKLQSFEDYANNISNNASNDVSNDGPTL